MQLRLPCCLLLLNAFGYPQQPEPGQPFKLVSEVRLVVLDVGVHDRKGQHVAGLTRDAFRVLDSGREQPLALFAREDAPVTIGLIADTSGSMQSKRFDVVAATVSFLESSNPKDETFLISFNDTVSPSVSGTTDFLRRTIATVPMGGRTSLFDGIHAGLAQLQKGSHERKALVILSDGGDNSSTLRRAQILREAKLNHATIYAIGISDPSDHDRDPGFLREIANLTGGDAYIDVPPTELKTVCLRIADEIRSRYTLGFNAAVARKEESRHIKVKATGLGREPLKVFCRGSYIATPSSEAQP